MTLLFFFFFFNDTATTEIYTLSLHDALPILPGPQRCKSVGAQPPVSDGKRLPVGRDQQRRCAQGLWRRRRSEEHTSELQSPDHLVCRLLLEKKKKRKAIPKRHTSRVLVINRR